MDDSPRHDGESQPGEFKVACDGTGGLVRVRLIGPPHEGRSLYMDELDLPAVIYTTGTAEPFEWWHERIHERMLALMARAPTSDPPVRYTLHVPEDTRAPVFRSEAAVGA